MPGRIVFLDWITRRMLREAPDARFVFGDNTVREGLGGQAGAMRGEPNAIGVATKWSPGGAEHDYYASGDALARQHIDDDIDRVAAALAEGRTIYVPRDGLGTGLSRLPCVAPDLHQHIINRFRALVPAGDAFPWEN
jgi:hypothetical protein